MSGLDLCGKTFWKEQLFSVFQVMNS